VIEVRIDKEQASFHTINGTEIAVLIYGREVLLKKDRIFIDVPEEWRG
jgi:hypothetical protein